MIKQPYRGFLDLTGRVVRFRRDTGWECMATIEDGDLHWEGDNFKIHFRYYQLANKVSVKNQCDPVGKMEIEILGTLHLPPFTHEALECDFKQREITIYGSARWSTLNSSPASTGTQTQPTRPTGLRTLVAKRVAGKGLKL